MTTSFERLLTTLEKVNKLSNPLSSDPTFKAIVESANNPLMSFYERNSIRGLSESMDRNGLTQLQRYWDHHPMLELHDSTQALRSAVADLGIWSNDALSSRSVLQDMLETQNRLNIHTEYRHLTASITTLNQHIGFLKLFENLPTPEEVLSEFDPENAQDIPENLSEGFDEANGDLGSASPTKRDFLSLSPDAKNLIITLLFFILSETLSNISTAEVIAQIKESQATIENRIVEQRDIALEEVRSTLDTFLDELLAIVGELRAVAEDLKNSREEIESLRLDNRELRADNRELRRENSELRNELRNLPRDTTNYARQIKSLVRNPSPALQVSLINRRVLSQSSALMDEANRKSDVNIYLPAGQLLRVLAPHSDSRSWILVETEIAGETFTGWLLRQNTVHPQNMSITRTAETSNPR